RARQAAGCGARWVPEVGRLAAGADILMTTPTVTTISVLSPHRKGGGLLSQHEGSASETASTVLIVGGSWASGLLHLPGLVGGVRDPVGEQIQVARSLQAVVQPGGDRPTPGQHQQQRRRRPTDRDVCRAMAMLP